MSRVKVLILVLVCTVLAPALLLAMFLQAVIGSEPRAQSMAVAFDECGNSLFGGEPTMTISTRVGNALLAGKGWARAAARFIDFFFGPGHCLANATTQKV